MDNGKLYWMNYSINIANGSKDNNLRVGAVLVTEDNKLVCSAYTDECSGLSWCEILLSKIEKINVNKAYYLFLTVNTLFSESEFDLNKLMEKIAIEEIYIGVPDPNLADYLSNDPIGTFRNIYRYSDNLKRMILQQNLNYYRNGKQNIKSSPYYSAKRISNIVMEKLQEKGIFISKEELQSNKQIEQLIQLIVEKYKFNIDDASRLVNLVMSEAFNSSFFNVKQAISEAHRVLKKDGIIIISIANGFLSPENQYIIPGLLIPGTEFVDIYRGFDIIKKLSTELCNNGFEDIKFFPTKVELFLTAKAKK